MYCDCSLTNYTKWKYTLYTSIIYVLVANPYSYKLVHKILGGISDNKGCPTSLGFVVHLVVFTLLLRLIM